MQEWLYRASTAKAKSAETWAIVKDFGFIHRSVYASASKAQRIPNVVNVAIGDIIHLYYIGNANVGRLLGVFRVVDPNDHPRGAQFGAAAPETALYTVVAADLREKLHKADYEPDPRLGEFCGWPVARETRSSPAYNAALFPGRNSLVLRPSSAPP
jgi:hypothetical protein